MIQNLELNEGVIMMRKYFESLARVASSEDERLEFAREISDYKYLEEVYGGKN